MRTTTLSAKRINMVGRRGDPVFACLQIDLRGIAMPCYLRLALPAAVAQQLAKRVDLDEFYRALVEAINSAGVTVMVKEQQSD